MRLPRAIRKPWFATLPQLLRRPRRAERDPASLVALRIPDPARTVGDRDFEQAVKDAAAGHDKAWTAALAAGWTEKNLREIGARAPGQSAPRARKRRAVTAPPAQNIEV